MTVDFNEGYLTAIEDLEKILTSGQGRTESYEDAMKFIDKVKSTFSRTTY